ncbi:MAG: nascent polypeptide-associated complex protein [Nanoarchaeota archaeon]
MIPGMNIDPRKMQSMLKQMGMQQEEISALRVIIEKEDGKITIDNPSIQKVKFHGQETFQISGEITEQSSVISEDDVQLISEKTGKSLEESREALEKTKDIAEAILLLS